jgi:DNA-binding response OmpR family regulator
VGSKILLVDDDQTLLGFLNEFLQNQGFQIVAASSGMEALRLAYQHQPDLAVLDIMMPGMDGWELCARLRELSDMPIILLTGKSSEADKLRGFRLGVDDYVTKPFSFAELTARIQAVLNRAEPRTQGSIRVLHCGSLVIDLDARQVRRGSEDILLSPTEYRLLEVLARRPGKAISEADLMHEIWGAHHHEETTAVRRYIWLLRKKVEEDSTHPTLIQTVRGYGYRLEPLPPSD